LRACRRQNAKIVRQPSVRTQRLRRLARETTVAQARTGWHERRNYRRVLPLECGGGAMSLPIAHHIVVATDFSPSSEHALEQAIELARLQQARLTLLHVVKPPAYSVPRGVMIAPAPDLLADLITAAEEQLELYQTRIALRGVAIDTACVVGEPSDIIVRYADEHRCDLIVTGSHGLRGFRRFFLGSVAEHVVRAASVPVLVVHHPPSQSATTELDAR
jgi:nucleotide-binding universal stress UspA family protein